MKKLLLFALLFCLPSSAQAGLIERLMHDEGVAEATWIPVHVFFAAINEVAFGALTGTQVRTALNITAGQDLTDWNQLAAQMPATDAPKAMFINRLHGVFILAEAKVTGYNTPAAVRTKLSITP